MSARVVGAALLVMVMVAIGGCGSEPAESAPGDGAKAVQPESPQATFDDASVTPAVMDKWARSCALCHAAGEAGAPRIGHHDEWAPRLAKGEAVLLQHTIEGFNSMPPLGYCMACEREDMRALIKLMATGPRGAS